MTRKKTRTRRGGGKRRTTRGGREDEDVPDLRTTSMGRACDVKSTCSVSVRGELFHSICVNRLVSADLAQLDLACLFVP